MQSNSFDNSSFWGSTSTTETSGQTGYDGSSDAWLLEKSGASGYVTQGAALSGAQTFSVYAKAGTLNWLALSNAGIVSSGVFFDLQNGLVGTSGAAVVASSIESVGGGWYRCSVTLNGAGTSPRIFPADADGDTSGTSGNILIQDAQLEQGLVATDYIETTTAAVYEGITDNLPRLDYSGGASCPSLLLEPSRTNLVPHSEYLNAASFFKTGTTITDNYGISPEGVQNSALLDFGATGTSSNLGDSFGGLTAGTDITFSLYVKGSGTIRIYSDGNGTAGYYFKSTDITLTNDWKREVLSYTIPAGVSASNFVIQRQVSDSATECEVYGFQVELGSYPTSYIPTYGTAASRAADSCANT